MRIHDIPADPGKRQKPKRIGRGTGSGHGTTAGKGTKGQKSRSGAGRKYGFEGGQTPIQMRVPKRGFHNISRIEYKVVNINTLGRFDDNSTVDLEMLKKSGLVKGRKVRVKVLGNGTLSKSLTVKAHAFSTSAQEKIASAGGSCEVIS